MTVSRYRDPILSMLLWTWGGTLYFFFEVVFKSLTGHPERISWTMLLLALILCIPLERMGAELPWEMPLPLQALICAVTITATEFVVGCVLNLWLGLAIWDYSDLWGNVLGQICPQFSALWYVFSIIFIPVFDWLRYAVVGGNKPQYVLF